MGDQGMDGLDALMAELASGESTDLVARVMPFGSNSDLHLSDISSLAYRTL
jgi:hypothetical protein